MPGTIQVSVLDVDLPSSYSSSFSSSISVKVSMGKREYQTMGKGDFSFPLTALRDNLVLTLLDGNGNELSRTGVETMSIVEKEIWDDLFPLEGGGQLHMKLQFILSDEERKRIREMRESALKKKHEELSSSHRQLDTPAAPDPTVGVNIASPSLSLKHEVAEKPAQDKALSIGMRYIQGVSISNPVSHSNNPESCPVNKDGTPLDQLEKTAPDGSEANPSEAPLSQDLNVLDPTKAYLMNFDGKIEINLPPADVPVKPIASLEVIDSQLGCSESSDTKTKHSAPAVMRKDQTHTPKETTLERTPSSVRNLISAFESSLAQEVGADGNAPTTTSQSRKTGLKYPLRGPFEEETIREKTKSMKQISSKHLNSLSSARFGEVRQQSPNHTTKHGDQVGLDAQTVHGPSGKLLPHSPGQLVVVSSNNTSTYQTNSSGITKFRGVDKLEYRREESESPEDFSGPSITEIATVSGRTLDGPLATNKPCALCTDQQDSSLGFVLKDNGCRNCRENSDKINIFGASNIWNKSVAHSEVERPGSWILPDGSRRLCITAGSKQVMELMGNWGVCRETHQREMSLFKMDAFDEHNIHDDSDIWVNKDDMTSQCSRTLNPEGSGDVTISGGLIGQVVKVAIMVAFGTLVLVTRQRKSRSL
ncbi:uncharacterized protein LOC122655717 isoform X2 [Telopea speciosissima]|uniref:uncharacterized protein LOC122655717 isoform X2 n=1 Tax=Telopea speciosissima TaxID=54955 RepID=UPI001CC4A52A|nr:uncharacterized protein LOC122655717 isoform X2 [Telopea speciosissima]